MPKGFSDSEKQLIRGRLLEQGFRQFSAHGLKRVTVEELAAAAGISKGAFYLFFDSKEALFMEVIEERAEKRFREEMLGMVDHSEGTPHERLLAILRFAIVQLKTSPLLQFFSGNDFDLLFRRIPEAKMRQHLEADRAFFIEFTERCREAGIPVRARAEDLYSLVYALVLGAVHEADWQVAEGALIGRAFDMLLELVVAFSLGEVELQVPGLAGTGRLPTRSPRRPPGRAPNRGRP